MNKLILSGLGLTIIILAIIQPPLLPSRPEFNDLTSDSSESTDNSNYSQTPNLPSEGTMKIKIPVLTDKEDLPDKFGCGDSIVYIEKSIPLTTQPLNTAYRELFSLNQPWIKDESLRDFWYAPAPNGESSGLYNVIYNLAIKDLKFDRATIKNGLAKVYLSGNFSGLGGVCDSPRVRPQLEAVAKQFSTVNSVEIYLNDSLFDWTDFGSEQ